jgi:hypothetical protein
LSKGRISREDGREIIESMTGVSVLFKRRSALIGPRRALTNPEYASPRNWKIVAEQTLATIPISAQTRAGLFMNKKH